MHLFTRTDIKQPTSLRWLNQFVENFLVFMTGSGRFRRMRWKYSIVKQLTFLDFCFLWNNVWQLDFETISEWIIFYETNRLSNFHNTCSNDYAHFTAPHQSLTIATTTTTNKLNNNMSTHNSAAAKKSNLIECLFGGDATNVCCCWCTAWL